MGASIWPYLLASGFLHPHPGAITQSFPPQVLWVPHAGLGDPRKRESAVLEEAELGF